MRENDQSLIKKDGFMRSISHQIQNVSDRLLDKFFKFINNLLAQKDFLWLLPNC